MISNTSGFSFLNPKKTRSFQQITGSFTVPSISFSSATVSSVVTSITNFDAAFTYSVSSSAGSASRSGATVTVSGLSGNQSTTVTVTATGSAGMVFSTTSSSFLSLPATPTLSQTGQTSNSVTVSITNYNAALTYTVGATVGTASRTADTITVTGITAGQTSVVTVTASNSSGNSAQGTINAQILPEGGTITVPGDGFRYHTFNSSGSFVNYSTRTVSYLLYAGGGGGGAGFLNAYVNSPAGGGGGAGGRIFSGSTPLPSGTFPLTIGAGGSASVSAYNNTTVNTPGSNSVFNSATATGGGRGFRAGNSGLPGGSGGGNNGMASPVNTGVSGQGHPGGRSSSNFVGGGGGGAGGTGGYSAGPGGASGGAGVTEFGVARGGGGAGGSYGTAGGPASSGGGRGGGPPSPAASGDANTGGGGGGGARGIPGGNGGSGVLVIRYPV